MTDLPGRNSEDRLPLLVLLPGMDGTGVMFQPLIHELGEKMRTVVVRYPKDQALNYDGLMKLVEMQLPDEPFALLGESFSGPIAVKIAATHPPGLRGVILCASFVRNPIWLLPARMSWMVRPIMLRAVIAALRFLVDMIDDTRSATAKLMMRSLDGARPEIWAFRARLSMTIDVRQELAAINCPMLYLRGEKDVLIADRAVRQIQAIQPAIKVASFPAGHLILQIQPAMASSVIRSFLARIGSR